MIDLIGGQFKGAFETVKSIFTNITNIFKNVIDFVKNVFTGNWKGAWENIKNIFAGIWEHIKTIVKAPINFIIDGLNLLINGINKISFDVPDWVPFIGGQKFGFNIPNIPKLRVGIDYVPYDEFPAILHKGEKVLTAAEAEDDKKKKSEKEEGAGDKRINLTLNLNIDNFNNNSGEDIERLADELMILLNDRIREKGAVFA